jgi:peroxiredoxin
MEPESTRVVPDFSLPDETGRDCNLADKCGQAGPPVYLQRRPGDKTTVCFLSSYQRERNMMGYAKWN